MIELSKLSNSYEVRRLGDPDAEDILAFCRKNTLFYQYCGAEATKEQILRDLHLTPPGVDASDKYYVGFFQKEKLIAVLDLIDGYPESDMGFIGFFMINAELQGKGLGSGIIRDVCAYLKQNGKIAVRLGIAKDNPQARHFWKKNGFAVIREIPQEGWTVLLAEKIL